METNCFCHIYIDVRWFRLCRKYYSTNWQQFHLIMSNQIRFAILYAIKLMILTFWMQVRHDWRYEWILIILLKIISFENRSCSRFSAEIFLKKQIFIRNCSPSNKWTNFIFCAVAIWYVVQIAMIYVPMPEWMSRKINDCTSQFYNGGRILPYSDYHNVALIIFKHVNEIPALCYIYWIYRAMIIKIQTCSKSNVVFSNLWYKFIIHKWINNLIRLIFSR